MNKKFLKIPALTLRACETLWSARETASVALLAERERHTKNMVHIVLSLK